MRSLLSALATLLLAAPLAGQDYHFTKAMSPGDRLMIENINGKVEVTQGSGRTAEITVAKTVKKGDGSLVKAIMESDGEGVRVCTIYLNQDRNRDSCKGEHNNSTKGQDKLEIDMHYVVSVPRGVRLSVDNVNGEVDARGLDATATIATVNGGLTFEGTSASSLSTVNGSIKATMTRGTWDGSMHVESVNGGIELFFPADLSATISGETVNGGIRSDDTFPITIQGKWGPKEFHGKIGSGSSKLTVESVNGAISIRKAGH